MGLIFNVIFSLTTVFIFFRSVAYGIYEIKNEKNKIGGFFFILLALFAIVFSNIMMWINV